MHALFVLPQQRPRNLVTTWWGFPHPSSHCWTPGSLKVIVDLWVGWSQWWSHFSQGEVPQDHSSPLEIPSEIIQGQVGTIWSTKSKSTQLHCLSFSLSAFSTPMCHGAVASQSWGSRQQSPVLENKTKLFLKKAFHNIACNCLSKQAVVPENKAWCYL